jgi:hypothetical protein
VLLEDIHVQIELRSTSNVTAFFTFVFRNDLRRIFGPKRDEVMGVEKTTQ